jgi:AcrR family transcriptional regulator
MTAGVERVKGAAGADGPGSALLGHAGHHLRADAQRNHARVLEAARAVFAEHGIDAPITLIAEQAGVGIGTVFRRFPTKQDLVVALIQQRGEQLVDAAEAALASDKPGEAFRSFFSLAAEQQIRDRGFCDSIGTQLFARADLRELFDGVRERVGRLLERAIEAGEVRSDIVAADVLFVLHGVARTGLMLEDSAPGVWRRYLGLALDGLRPEAATALPRKAPTKRQVDNAACGGG